MEPELRLHFGFFLKKTNTIVHSANSQRVQLPRQYENNGVRTRDQLFFVA